MWTAIRPLVLTMVFCSLTTTSAWAQDIASEDSIADEVELRDGTVIQPRKVPKRAPSEDYVYTYKGVKYTYITENNYTRYFNTNVHKPSDYGWYTDAEGWYVNAEKAYITAASIDADNFPSSGEVYILNDLVGFFKDHPPGLHRRQRLPLHVGREARLFPGLRCLELYGQQRLLLLHRRLRVWRL